MTTQGGPHVPGARATAVTADVAAAATEAPDADAGLFDVLGLAARIAAGRLRGDGTQEAVCRWARAAAGIGAPAVRIRAFGKRVELLLSRERSDRILKASPETGPWQPGNLKKGGMSFLAPHALTIAHGDEWRRLRTFNEGVLGTGGVHPYAQRFLDNVRTAFAGPVRNGDDVRAAMGRAMVAIVLGDPPADGSDPVDDVGVLIAVVQSPLRRRALGFRYRGRRERLYRLIGERWRAAREDDRTLIALASRTADGPPGEDMLQQVPHWMFTFIASGADLLTRTLALIAARPIVRNRVLAELAVAGPLDEPRTIGQLRYLDACMLEAGRLFPPATRTFHHTANGEDREVVHFFPLLQRDPALGATVDHYVPDRWLQPKLDPAAAASNLFLRGPRACPGSDLIRFVCRGAAARLFAELDLAAPTSILSRDPLPLSFPERAARFTATQVTP